jgi:hypothetical protein
MTNIKTALAIILMVAAFAIGAQAQNTSNYSAQGGATWVVGGTQTVSGTLAVTGAQTIAGTLDVGGDVDINTGGTVDVESGATIDVAGTAGIDSGGVLNVESGGTLNVVSGGTADVASGGTLTVAGAQTVSGSIDLTGTVSKDGTDLTSQLHFTKYDRVTIAEVNAGHELLPAIATRQYRITGVKIRAIGGAAGSVTSVDIQDDNGTPVVVAAFAQANLTENTILLENSTGATMGAGYMLGTTAGKAIDIIKNGADVDTATHFDVVLEYQIF